MSYVNITFNNRPKITLKNEERILIILLDDRLNTFYNFILDLNNLFTEKIEELIKDKFVFYHVLYAIKKNIPLSLLLINPININLAFSEVKKYIENELMELEYIFKYIPLIMLDRYSSYNIETITNFITELQLFVQYLYDKSIGGILYYTKNHSINDNFLFVQLEPTRSVIDYDNFIYPLYLNIMLAEQRIESKYSKPHIQELLGYQYDTYLTNKLVGFYELKRFLKVYDYEYILSAIVTIKWLIYRLLVLYKHRYFTYSHDIQQIIESIIYEYTNKIIKEFDTSIQIYEDINLLTLNLKLTFLKPIITVNVTFNYNI
ncbi:MAG: hypothetical protein QXW35_05465 [Candidatus Aenigmatarchaeota archaeon]